jgi:phosphonate transport system substrate-binding protein
MRRKAIFSCKQAFPTIFLFVCLIVLTSTIVLAEEYTFGVVPQFETRQLHAIWKPVLEELTSSTGHTFKLLGSQNIPTFEKSVAQGEYDFIYSNPWHAVVAWEEQGYIPIIRDSSRDLTGILVVQKNGAIRAIRDLKNTEIAFPAPNAMGASLLMRSELKRMHDIDIHPIYVGTHSSVFLNVVVGSIRAGGAVMSTFLEQPKEIRDRLIVLHETRAISPHPISAHPRVPSSVVADVSLALQHMNTDHQKKRLIEQIPMYQAGPASLDEYLILKDWGVGDFYVKP